MYGHEVVCSWLSCPNPPFPDAQGAWETGVSVSSVLTPGAGVLFRKVAPLDGWRFPACLKAQAPQPSQWLCGPAVSLSCSHTCSVCISEGFLFPTCSYAVKCSSASDHSPLLLRPGVWGPLWGQTLLQVIFFPLSPDPRVFFRPCRSTHGNRCPQAASQPPFLD